MRTKDSTPNSSDAGNGNRVPEPMNGCSTAATKSVTTLTRVGLCCGAEGAAAAAVNIVEAVVRASAEGGAKEYVAGLSSTAARLNVCACCGPDRADSPAVVVIAGSGS